MMIRRSQPEKNSTKRICVFCASSRSCDPAFHHDAFELGTLLAGASYTVVYGGGAFGSMGALADGALSHGGYVVGVLPNFMATLEWGHTQISELHLVEDMRSRKHMMLSDSNAVVALPGGCGTLEEIMEALTLKRLGIYLNPIVLVNTKNFFSPLIDLLQRCVEERFLDVRHLKMCTIVSKPDEVLEAIRTSEIWSSDARSFAAL
jgi:uncharacterized protein (TIGR00730 family)